MKKIINKAFVVMFLLLLVSSSVFANQKLDVLGKKNLRSGNMHKAGKRYDKAIGFYLKVLEENPNHIEAAKKLADIYYSAKNDYEKAFKYFSLAIKSIDNEINELKKLQQEKPKKKKKYQKKINAYLKDKENLEKYIQSSWVKLYKKGADKLKENNIKEALQEFKKLNEIAPDSAKTLKMISFCYIKTDSLDKAISYLNKALEISNDYQARAQLADLYFKKKDFKNAAEQYEKLIQENPENPDNYYNICLVYNNLKEYDKALEKIDKFIELKPDDKDGYALGFETAKSKDPKDYKTQIKYYKKYADLNPDDANTQQYIFLLYFNTKKYEDALPYGEKWFSLDKTKEGANMVALCAKRAGKEELAKKYFDLANKIKK